MSLTSQQIARNTRISAILRSYELGVMDAHDACKALCSIWAGE